MDLDRVKAIARYYNDVLGQGQCVGARKTPPDLHVTDFKAEAHVAALHLRAMVPELIEMADAGRTEKCMRWLGFMQGVLWRNGTFTLDELKEHSRPDVPAPVWPETSK